MANYATLIAAIQSVITQNGNNEITGPILQQTLISVVNSLGSGYQFIGIATPETTPGTPDQKVFYIGASGTYPNFGPAVIPNGNLAVFYYDSSWHYGSVPFPLGNGSVTTEKLEDGAVTLAKLAQTLTGKLFSYGYKYMGVVTPTTTPGTLDQNVFYFPSTQGTYTNFGSLQVENGEIAIIKYNGSWSKETVGFFATREQVNDRIIISPGKNLFNPGLVTTGVYINTYGGFSSNSSYGVTDFIPVTTGQYNLSCYLSNQYQSLGTSSACINLYDSSFQIVSTVSGANQQLSVPANVAYIRASFRVAATQIQIERGSSRTPYEAFNPVIGYLDDFVKRSELEYRLQNKVDLNSKNLYDASKDTATAYFNTAGNIITNNPAYHISDFIPVSQGNYYISAKSGANIVAVGSSSACFNLYDENKQRISTISGGSLSVSIPNGIYYIRISINTANSEIQVERGTSRTTYETYNPISGYLSGYAKESELLVFATKAELLQYAKKVELLNKVDSKLGKNLFDKDTITTGVYFNNANGSTNTNVAYAISDYIKVIPGSSLFISYNQAGAVSPNNTYLIFYDSTLSVLSGVAMGVNQFTVPDGAAFMRFTLRIANAEIQVEIGTSRTTYEPYSPIAGYPVIIPDGAISYNKLDEPLKERIDNISSSRFSRFYQKATLNVSEVVTTQEVQIEKDSLLSALIVGTIQQIQVGVGKLTSGYTYLAHWLEIDATDVRFYWHNNDGNVLIATYQHGLTLTNKTTVMVDSKIVLTQKVTVLKIYDDLGNVFEQSLSRWGVGAGFILNQNTTGAIQCELSLMPRQITKKIWLIGDSYVSFTSNIRWPYYFAQLGMLDYFSNNQPGLNPQQGYNALVSLLSLGVIPSIVVWTLGMNGSTTEEQSGGTYIINDYQKQYIDAVAELQQEYGFTLILGTVPTVPTRQKTGFCNYVRNLGYRYIDFAAAVGADSSGNWNTGLLSDDGVHPSELGAKVLASRVFVDCPELSIIE